ncbi:hypothetical protein Acsp06_43590 [Actinomycetospora sp. NBRC 106375]|nr:hypothetical protein Acsp06_43590 [Actinomycetospora sp. NBRC 106375]
MAPCLCTREVEVSTERRVRATIPACGQQARDLVGREFNPTVPDWLWVADPT